MRTIFSFTESLEKQKVILKHDKDVKIYKEIRKDHIEWKDMNGNLIENRSYIVIRYPKSKKIDLRKWNQVSHSPYATGLLIRDLGSEIEILLYDQITFSWIVEEMSEIGLFKAQRRVIPNFKENGELFPAYINPEGVWQLSYDLFFGLLQLPFVLYKERKQKLKEVKEL